MRYRKLDENGDMRFGNQQADFLRDSREAVGQAISTRLGLITGEWFLDTTKGTPYFTAIIGMNTRKTAELAWRTRILETQGVTSIESFSLPDDEGTRKASPQATVNTVYGQTQI